jgi:hypothetical protein
MIQQFHVALVLKLLPMMKRCNSLELKYKWNTSIHAYEVKLVVAVEPFAPVLPAANAACPAGVALARNKRLLDCQPTQGLASLSTAVTMAVY